MERDEGLLLGRYRIAETIGKGGMSVVYRAYDIRLEKDWAVKMVDTAQFPMLDFLAEPNLLKNLDHPALPRIVDILKESGRIYIVEDFIRGETLERQIQRDGPLTEREGIDVLDALCDVMTYLHGQTPPILYRDMKPSNVMRTQEGRVKLIDFGIAQRDGERAASAGTRGYAASEQLSGGLHTVRTDVYNLGATMFHLLTGIAPVSLPVLPPLREVDERFSEGIEYIVHRMTMSDPGQRYASMEDVRHDLRHIHKLGASARRTRRRRLGIAAAAGALVFALAGGVIAHGVSREREQREAFQQMFKEADALAAAQEWDAASAAYDGIIEMLPDDGFGYAGKAGLLYRQGALLECLEYIAQQVPAQTAASDAALLHLAGVCHLDLQRYEDALFVLQRAVQLQADNTEYIRDYIICLAKTGALEEANLQLQAYRGTVDEVTLDHLHAELLLAQGQTEEALEALEKCLAGAKDTALRQRIFVSIASTLRDQRDLLDSALDREIACLTAAMLEPELTASIALVEMLGEAYAADKQPEEAIAQFARLLELNYRREYVYQNIALLYQETGNLARALEITEQRAELFPQSYACHMQLSLLYIENEARKPFAQRDYALAYECYMTAYALCPLANRVEWPHWSKGCWKYCEGRCIWRSMQLSLRYVKKIPESV